MTPTPADGPPSISEPDWRAIARGFYDALGDVEASLLGGWPYVSRYAAERLQPAIDAYEYATDGVIVCACQCHHPIGCTRPIDKPIPPVMQPCRDCASNEH